MTFIKSTCPLCNKSAEHMCLNMDFNTKVLELECTDCDREYLADFEMVVSNQRLGHVNLKVFDDKVDCPFCDHEMKILIRDDEGDFEATNQCENCKNVYKIRYESPAIVVDAKKFVEAGGSLGEGFSIPLLKRKAPESIFLREQFENVIDDLIKISDVTVSYTDPESGELRQFKGNPENNVEFEKPEGPGTYKDPEKNTNFNNRFNSQKNEIENITVQFCDDTTATIEPVPDGFDSVVRAIGPYRADQLKKFLDDSKEGTDDAKDD